MPRLSTLSLGVLNDLAGQLRFAPPARAAEVVARAVALAEELHPDRAYPEDWLVHRLTGYTPDAAGVSVAVGSAIRRDLSAFCERVSHQARLTDAELADTIPLATLTARWSVTPRSIERYRREGLIAVRLVGAGGSRLVFPRRSVEWFERARADALRTAGSRTRLTPAERARAVRVAQRARRRFGWSLNQAARRLARRTGRSHEGLRQVLLRADPGGGAGIGRGDRRRRVIARALRAGVTTARLAERFGKSPATIRRLGLEARLAIVRESAPTPDARVVGSGALDSPLTRSGLRPVVERTLGEWDAIARATPPPRRDEERALADALAALLARIAAGLEEDAGAPPTLARVDRLETDLRWAGLIAGRLVASQRGFILAAVEARLGGPVLDLTPAEARALHRAAMDAAIGAVWRHRPTAGGRLAGVTGVAVDRAVAAWRRAHPARPGEAAGRARTASAPLDDWTDRLGPWQRWLDPPPRLTRAIGDLDERTRAIRRARFGLAGHAPMTREETARALGLSRRAVTQALSADRPSPVTRRDL